MINYTGYLEEIDAERIENVAAPHPAIDYWKLGKDARLREIVIAVRLDEANHRDVNHRFADQMRSNKSQVPEVAQATSQDIRTAA